MSLLHYRDSDGILKPLHTIQGKSAYQGAVEGGYRGTEEEFNQMLANPHADYIPSPSSASVGQTIRVSAVDENGKPTEWEAVDFPEGGDGGLLSLISSQDVTEDLLTFVFDNLDQYDEVVILLTTTYGVVTSATAEVKYTRFFPMEGTATGKYNFFKIGTGNKNGNGVLRFMKKADGLTSLVIHEGVQNITEGAPQGTSQRVENTALVSINSVTVTFNAVPTNGCVWLYAR